MSSLQLRIEPPTGQAIERAVEGDSVTFGRGMDVDVVCQDGSMSRRHGRIVARSGGWLVEDLGARNGTFVNGERIDSPTPVRAGDIIKMGATLIRVLDEPAPSSSAVPRDTLGEGNLSSSIFRPIADMAGDASRTALYGGAAARVAVRLKALNDFHRALAGAIALDALLDLLLDQLFAVLRPEEGVILLRQLDGSLRTAASRRLPGATGELLVSQRLVREVVDKSTAALVTDVAVDERFASSHSIVATGVRSILAAPFTDAEGCVGMVAIYSRTSIRRFGEEDLDLLVSLASAAALRIRNVELAEEAAARRVEDRELALAHDIQMGMLPRAVPDRPEIVMAATLIPARAVGGNLYDFFTVGDALWFIVADAAGKGVGAALFMAMTRTLFRALARGDATPSSVVERMNAELARDNERQFFVTATVGRIALGSGELSFCNAGHPLPLRSSPGSGVGPLPVPPGGIALGVVEDATYEESRVTLAAGDAVLLFTDGVTEAVNPSGELFSEDRLLREFAGCAAAAPADMVDHILDAVNRFAGVALQEDDITLLAVRFVGTPA
jgi:serine phosphatase RsbU (regulator of sigma subunit)